MSQAEDELKQQEKERLKEEILDALKKESLKKEILNELRPTDWKHQISQVARHPLILLVFGFALTGGVGALLTAYWENKKWDYQQRRLAQIRYVEERVSRKRSIKEEVKKSIEMAITAHETILETITKVRFSNNLDEKDIHKELSERRKQWDTAMQQNWESGSQLYGIIQLEFKKSPIFNLFSGISDNVSVIRDKIRSILFSMDFDFQWTNEVLKSISDLSSSLNDVRRQLHFLLIEIEKEIQADETATFQAGTS